MVGEEENRSREEQGRGGEEGRGVGEQVGRRRTLEVLQENR